MNPIPVLYDFAFGGKLIGGLLLTCDCICNFMYTTIRNGLRTNTWGYKKKWDFRWHRGRSPSAPAGGVCFAQLHEVSLQLLCIVLETLNERLNQTSCTALVLHQIHTLPWNTQAKTIINCGTDLARLMSPSVLVLCLV